MGQQATWSRQAVFPAEEASVARARAFVIGQLADHDVPHLHEDVRLVTSELATNAVGHAATPFVVTIEGNGSWVRLTVEDGSVRHPTVDAPEPLALNGRGLILVRHLSSDWGISGASDRGAKGVWAAFETGVAAASSA